MSKLLLIKREFIAKVKNVVYRNDILSPLLFCRNSCFCRIFKYYETDLKTIAIHDESGKFVDELKYRRI
jgi:ABC-2 type transport system permease protein